jgi:hypothetical protein
MHSPCIGTGREQARNNGVSRAILCTEDNYISNRRSTLPAWPLTTGRHRCNNGNRELALARAGFTSNTGVLPQRETAGPKPFNLFGCDFSCAARNQDRPISIGFPLKNRRRPNRRGIYSLV